MLGQTAMARGSALSLSLENIQPGRDTCVPLETVPPKLIVKAVRKRLPKVVPAETIHMQEIQTPMPLSNMPNGIGPPPPDSGTATQGIYASTVLSWKSSVYTLPIALILNYSIGICKLFECSQIVCVSIQAQVVQEREESQGSRRVRRSQ